VVAGVWIDAQVVRLFDGREVVGSGDQEPLMTDGALLAGLGLVWRMSRRGVDQRVQETADSRMVSVYISFLADVRRTELDRYSLWVSGRYTVVKEQAQPPSRYETKLLESDRQQRAGRDDGGDRSMYVYVGKYEAGGTKKELWIRQMS
jgi:hypothetical protein